CPHWRPDMRNPACQAARGGNILSCLRVATAPIKKLEIPALLVANLPTLGFGTLASGGRFVSVAPRLVRVGEAVEGGEAVVTTSEIAGASVRFAQRGISPTFLHGEFAGQTLSDV